MVPQVSADPAGILDYPRRLTRNKCYFAFGGGVGRFGTNFTVFHLNGTSIWIDLGSGFANHHTPGMEKNLPNRQLLLGFPPTAIFLTHGHEDHIGAVPHLVDVIPVGTPIYASPFTTALLTNRLKDRGVDPSRWQFNLIEENSKHTIGDFNVFTFFMPHSIPQCFSVGLEADVAGETKRVYFSSDFKLKGAEVRHKVQQIKKFAPVDFLFVDSTGALHDGETADEREVDESLEKLIRNTKGRIFLTTFASQVERIKNIVKSAAGAGRPVGFLGRSLKGQWEAAFQSKEVSQPLHLMKQPSFTSQNALWLVAGCQADKNSSFSRLTHGTMAKIRIKKDDTLIYSASMIPGNEGKIYEALNLAADQGAHIVGVSSGEVRVHASGHGRRGDIEKLIGYLKPRNILPVHGDPLHFTSFLRFIQDKKINIALTQEHKIYALADEPEFIESLPDETCLVEPGEVHFEQTIYKERVHLSGDGICMIVLNARFEVLDVSFTGVMSQEFERKISAQMMNTAGRVASEVAGVAEANRDKKFRDRLGRELQELIGRIPYIKLIRPKGF